MASPNPPHVVSGTARKGPLEGISEIVTTIQGSGGQTVNLFVSSGSELATSQTITVIHTSSNEELTATTDSNGDYAIDLASLTSYSSGDEIKVKLDTRTAIPVTEGLDNNHKAAKARKVVIVDNRGTDYDEVYPLPVSLGLLLRGHVDVYANCDTSWTITRQDGQPDSETVTLPNGDQYTRSYNFDSNNRIISRTKWTKV